jgi:hypothetical protein
MRVFYWRIAPYLFLCCLFAGLVYSKGVLVSVRHPFGVILILAFTLSIFQGDRVWRDIEQLRKKYPARYDDWVVTKAFWLGTLYLPDTTNDEFARDLAQVVHSNFNRTTIAGLAGIVLMVILGFSGYFRAN